MRTKHVTLAVWVGRSVGSPSTVAQMPVVSSYGMFRVVNKAIAFLDGQLGTAHLAGSSKAVFGL